MNETSIARRYAKALFELAVEVQRFEEVGQELAGARAALESDPDVLLALSDPRTMREDRLGVAEGLVKALALSPEVANALRLMAERARLVLLPLIEAAYRELADERAGRIRARITSAAPLSEEEARQLTAQLAKVTRRTVVIEKTVDPALLGGVVAQVGSRVYDGSLRTQFEDLKRQLKA